MEKLIQTPIEKPKVLLPIQENPALYFKLQFVAVDKWATVNRRKVLTIKLHQSTTGNVQGCYTERRG
jgi:hypothetical protein